MTKRKAPYPYLGINGEYLEKAFLDSVWEYLERQAPLWAAGLEAPSPADKFAYQVMKQITMRRPNEEEDPEMARITHADILEARQVSQEHDLGMGLIDLKRSIVVARARFEGDLLLGMLWVSASGLAVAVGRNLPTPEARAEARDRWNDDWARRRKDWLLNGRPEEPASQTRP